MTETKGNSDSTHTAPAAGGETGTGKEAPTLVEQGQEIAQNMVDGIEI